MCRRHNNSDKIENMDREKGEISNSNDGERDKFDSLYENFGKVKGNLKSIAIDAFDRTNDSINDIGSRALDLSRSWWSDNYNVDLPVSTEELNGWNTFVDGFETSFDNFFGNPWQHRSWLDMYPESDFSISFSPLFGGLSDLLDGTRKSGRTPFGLFALNNPPIGYYNECINRKGESLWDSQGYWRCLFPNSDVTKDLLRYKSERYPDKVFTKDDLDRAMRDTSGATEKDGVIDLGSKGKFFRQFTDYLNWKTVMFNNIREERARKANEFARRLEQQKSEVQSVPQFDDNERRVVSSLSECNYQTNDDSNEVISREVRTLHFTDGSSSTKTTTRVKPIGATEWANVLEEMNSDDSAKSNTGSGKSNGWFWNDNAK